MFRAVITFTNVEGCTYEMLQGQPWRGRKLCVAMKPWAARIRTSLEDSRNVFPPHVPQVKLARKRDAVGVLYVTRLRDRHMLVEHPVHGDIPGSRLMDQPLHGNRIEVRLDPVRIQSRGYARRPQAWIGDVPVRIVVFARIVVQQRIAGKGSRHDDRPSQGWLVRIARRDGAKKALARVLDGSQARTVDAQEVEMFVGTRVPVADDGLDVLRTDGAQAT
jgi:hypothetical protein